MSTANLGISHIAAAQNQPEVTANEAFDALDNAVNRKVFFPMADADITLTQEELASGGVIVATGALSASRDFNLPANQRLFVFENATTGGYDVVVKVPSSPGLTVTVPCDPGTLLLLYSDGQDVIQIVGGTSGSPPASDTLPDLYGGPDPVPGSPNAADDEFEGAALDGAWTLYNSTNLTVTVAQSRVALSVVSQGGYQARGFFKAAPGATFEFTAKISWNFLTPSSVWANFGLTLRESATDKMAVIGASSLGSGSAQGATWSSGTSGPSQTSYGPIGLIGSMYVRIKDDGSNIIMSASGDGVIWQVIKTVAVATAFTTAPDQVGFTLNDAANDGNTRYYSVDWLRRTI